MFRYRIRARFVSIPPQERVHTPVVVEQEQPKPDFTLANRQIRAGLALSERVLWGEHTPQLISQIQFANAAGLFTHFADRDNEHGLYWTAGDYFEAHGASLGLVDSRAAISVMSSVMTAASVSRNIVSEVDLMSPVALAQYAYNELLHAAVQPVALRPEVTAWLTQLCVPEGLGLPSHE